MSVDSPRLKLHNTSWRTSNASVTNGTSSEGSMLPKTEAVAPSMRADVILAFVLSSGLGLAGAATVPLLLPALPADAQRLPLPTAYFCVVLAIQATVLYGLVALAGLRVGRRCGLHPTRILDRLRTRDGYGATIALTWAVAAGLATGALLLAVVAAIQQGWPGTLPTMLHPPTAVAALTASVAAAIGEEILFRLFLVSILIWMLPQGRAGVVAAIILSSFLFGVAHSPAFVFLFGGIQSVPMLAWVWLISLNGLCGAVYAMAFLQSGVSGAILAHFATDVVWHVGTRLIPS